MPVLALFGINNSGLNTAAELVILFLVVIWLALIYYTYSDARRRIEDKMLVGCATLASLFPYAGTLVYMIVRPPEFIEDRHEREMEMQAAEARLHQFEYLLCPHCDHEVEKDFLRCPSCMQKLKDACINCAKPLHPEWRLCPYCETEVRAKTPTRRRRRQATRSEEPVAVGPPTELAEADAPDIEASQTSQPPPGDDSGDATRPRRRGRTSEEEPVGSESSPES